MHVLPCLRSSALVAVIGTGLALVAASAARAADGTWAVDADGLWSETTNWQGGVLASGSGSTAFFNQVDLTADRAVQLDVDYTLTNLVFGDSGSDPDSNWTLGNNGLSANNLILAGTTPTITVESATTTIQAVIEGSSGLTKAGAGALVLSGANTFTGMTTITNSGSSFVNGNRLTLANPTGAALSGSVTIGNDTGGTTSGAVLFMNNANQFGPDSVVTINNPTSGYGYFILNGRSQTVRGIVAETARSPQVIENSDTAAVGATTLTLNAAAGDAHVFRGSLQRTWNGGANVGALNLVKTGAGTQTLAGTHILKQGQNTTDNYIGNVTVNQGTLVFENATSAGSGNAATSFTVAAGATLEFAISTGVTHNLGSTAAGGTGLAGAGTLRKTGPGILALSNQGSSTFAVNVALSAGGLIDVQAGTLRNGGWQGQTWSNNRASLAIASGASFDVWDGTSPVVDALTGAGSVLKGGGTGSVSRTLTVGIANGSGTFSGTIDDAGSGSNTLSLTKTGTGTQTLSGANTYRGTTVISSGILAISNNTALGATSGNTTIAATGSSTGPQLSLSGGITSAEPISITGNSAQNQYVGVITNTSGTNTLSGAITLASPSGGIRLSSGGGELILSGTISQTGTTRTLTLQATGGAALTVNNAIANNGGALFVINTGVTTLKGASTAIGATTIAEGGYLKLGVTNAIRDNQNLTIGSPWNFAGSDQGTFDLAGFNQTVNALVGTKNTSGTIGADSTRIVTNSVTGTSTLTVGNGNTAGTFNGVIQDGGAGRIVALTKTGTNTQTLVGDSNYSGVTTISGGTLQVGSGGSTGSLGSGAVVNGAALVFDRSGSLTVANAISGSGSLTKSGPGEVVLSGANSYAGTTTLTAGTLRVGNGTSGSLASTPVTFSGPGRLSLEQAPDTAQSLGALTFSAGAGTVASVYPGSGTTSVTFGSLAARAAGATGNFVVTGGTNGSTNSIVLTGAATNALLGPGYFFNGSNYAWYDTAGFVRATTTGDAGFVTAPAGTTFGAVDPASNVNVTGGITAQPTATVNTVRLADAVAANNAVTVTTGNTLSLAGILKAGGNAGTIGGGTLTAATAGGEVVVRSDAAADTLTISSVIADNTSASRLTTTGDGRVILLATNTHSGGTTVASGTLQLGNGTTSGNLSGTTMIQPGAVLEVNPTGTGTGAANTLAGPLAGGGLLRKTGSGRVSLNQTSSSFTGNVEIEAGTLRISGVNNTSLGQKTSARTITVAAGATLESSANNPFGTNGDSAAVIPTLQINGTFLVSTSLATVGNVTLSGGTLDTRSGGAGLGILLNGNVTVTGSSKSTIIGTSGLVGLNRLSPFNSRFDVADVASGVDFEVLRSLANGGASPSNLIKAGPGTMLLGDTNTFTGTVTVEAGTLLINGATTSASAMTVQAGGTLGGSGSIGTAITGAGTVSPGNSAGIFTAPQFNGSGGLGAVFEFTGTSPTWSAATASVNDVLRLTDLTTPFPASLSAASEIDILFDIAGLPGSVPVAPGTYTGGFFTDLQTDFLSSISGGDFRYWVRGTFGGTQQSFDGVVYSPLSAFDPSLSVTLGTVPVTAGFAGGSINGQSMQLVVVPEPATLALAGIGLAALGWRVCRRR